MKKSEKLWLSAGIILLVLCFVNIVLELLSVSVFIFGMRLLHAAGVLTIASAIAFAVFAFVFFKHRKSRFKGKKWVFVVKAFVVLSCVFVVFAGLVVNGALYEKTVYKAVSDDKRHVLLVTADAEELYWRVSVYKRNTGMFLIERDSELLRDMASFNEDITVEWVEDGCKMRYTVYTADAASPADTETVVQRFYFDGR